MSGASLGEQELSLLRYVAERGPVSVGQAANEFGAERELARSTVLTMMERLRRKKRLQRRRVEGVYLYASTQGPEALLRGVVHDFVEGKLAGSVSPFVNYLTEKAEVSERELAELEQLVARLQTRRVRRGRR